MMSSATMSDPEPPTTTPQDPTAEDASKPPSESPRKLMSSMEKSEQQRRKLEDRECKGGRPLEEKIPDQRLHQTTLQLGFSR